MEEPFINWTYTESILITAYDLLKNESLLYYLDSNSLTLREMMIEHGFPQKTKIFADSGIFSLEWFKKIKGRTFNKDFSAVQLKPKEVLYAYELIDPDYLCPLDEIILPSDKEAVIKQKKLKIKNNILLALECFSSSKLIGVLQGIKSDDIAELFDFEKDQGIRNFARGGIIPLYYHKEYCDSIRSTRLITKHYSLHAFGLTNLNQVGCYGKCAGMDSFDTTLIRSLTSQMFFLTKKLQKKRFHVDLLSDCKCPYCIEAREYNYEYMDYPPSRLIKNLYLHNILTLANYSNNVVSVLEI